MSFFDVQSEKGIVSVFLRRGKVNALNEEVIEEMSNTLAELELDSSTMAVILSGEGKFFSFDIFCISSCKFNPEIRSLNV